MGDKNETPVAVKKVARWVRSRSVREKVWMGSIAAFILLIFLVVFVKNQTVFFYGAQISHAIGIFVLIYKLTISKTCSGLSLRTQELTAIYLSLRIFTFWAYRTDSHLVIDVLTLGATLWVIYMMRVPLKSTYMAELDNMPLYYVMVPSLIVSLIAHPGGLSKLSSRWLFALWMDIDAVSVIPQLRLIKNAKMVEPFTAHYVFAMGVARFFECANVIYMLIATKGEYLMMIGHGHIWVAVVFLREIVQTFVLADFCYYYVKSVIDGKNMMKLPGLV